MPSPQLENIGLALQGLGAGLGGQLPQFLQAQNQKQGLQMAQEDRQIANQEKMQAMAIERQKTMFTDANAALNLLDSGNVDGVIQLGMQRLQMLKQLSAQDPSIDPSDTQRVTQLAIAARNGDEEATQLLREELKSTVDVGQAMGVLQKPEAPKGATDLGKYKQDLDAGLITQDQYDKAVRSGVLGGIRNVQRSVEVPGQGFNKVYEDGATEFSPYSVEQAQAYAASQQMALSQAGNMASVEATASSQAQARQALKNTVNEGALAARDSMPRLDRLLDLADVAETGNFGEMKTNLSRLLGRDVANEEEFMALANQEILAAADSLKGALSDRENAYLEAVGPGIGKSREGNKRIIKNIRTIAENAIERQKALKEFSGDPSEFYFQGKSFNDTLEAIEDGTIISNSQGEYKIYKNGEWRDY